MSLESSLTLDKLNLMHSILDREIESLASSTNQNYGFHQGEPLLLSNNTEKGKPPVHRDQQSQNRSNAASEFPQKSNMPNNQQPLTPGVYTNPFDKDKDSKINKQMQDDLNELQKKIFNLEKKLSKFNSSSKMDSSITNNLENNSEEDTGVYKETMDKNSKLALLVINPSLI